MFSVSRPPGWRGQSRLTGGHGLAMSHPSIPRPDLPRLRFETPRSAGLVTLERARGAGLAYRGLRGIIDLQDRRRTDSSPIADDWDVRPSGSTRTSTGSTSAGCSDRYFGALARDPGRSLRKRQIAHILTAPGPRPGLARRAGAEASRFGAAARPGVRQRVVPGERSGRRVDRLVGGRHRPPLADRGTEAARRGGPRPHPAGLRLRRAPAVRRSGVRRASSRGT